MRIVRLITLQHGILLAFIISLRREKMENFLFACTCVNLAITWHRLKWHRLKKKASRIL